MSLMWPKKGFNLFVATRDHKEHIEIFFVILVLFCGQEMTRPRRLSQIMQPGIAALPSDERISQLPASGVCRPSRTWMLDVER